MGETVGYELDEGIATITIDDGKVNAFSIDTLTSLHGALDRAESDDAVVVLTGREGCFTAGFDLKVFAGGEVGQILRMLNLGATLAERVMGFPTPVLIASSGHAVAAGAFLLLAADVRIGTDGDYRTGLNEVAIGLAVPRFVIEIASRRLHPGHFPRAVIDAAIYTPAEAVAVGYYDAVVPPGELRAHSLAEAARLAQLDRAAYAETKSRARSQALEAIRAAIEGELSADGLAGARPPL